MCDSYVRPATLVRICDECNYGSYAGRCVICGGIGVSDAYYCKECTIQEKDVSAAPTYLPPFIYICFSCCVLGRRESVRTEVGFTKWVLVSGRCTPFLAAPNCFTHSASIAASGKWQLYRNGCCFTSAAAAAAVAAGDAADCQAPRCPPCVQRDGCPKIINLGSAKTDLFYVSEGASAVRCCACPAGVVRCAGTHASRGRSVDSQHAAATEPSKPARGQPTGSGGLPPACRRRLRAAAAWSATCPLLS